MSEQLQKFLKIKSKLPKAITQWTDKMEEALKKGPTFTQLDYVGYQQALETEIKCYVMAGELTPEDAYIISDEYGVNGIWEKIYPFP